MSAARPSALLLIALVALLALAPTAGAKARPTTMRTSQRTITTTRLADSVRHMKFRWGPVRIGPGQNTISIADDNLLPPGPGWITSFKPNLTYLDGKVPRVDVIHLHHGVWLNTSRAESGSATFGSADRWYSTTRTCPALADGSSSSGPAATVKT